MKKLAAVVGLCVLIPPLLGVVVIVWIAMPPWVGPVVLGLFAAGFVWWRMRRSGAVLPGSEGSLVGRQTSKDGLL